ncbi:MAG: YkgJ family cysteine cluster protein [Pseudomonadota bacterium]
MSDHQGTTPPVVIGSDRDAVRALYRDLDDSMTGYLEAHPGARCPGDCHRCCTRAAPLVSDVEFALIDQAFENLDDATRQQVREQSRALRGELEKGAPDDFACPLLRAGRCLVYAARPYLCRSFGHTSRLFEGGLVRPYTCEVLQGAVARSAPPLVDARIAALRHAVGRVVDSYLPIWLSTAPQQRVARWPEPDRAVVVASDEARVDGSRSG